MFVVAQYRKSRYVHQILGMTRYHFHTICHQGQVMSISADFSKLETLSARLGGLEHQIAEQLAERVIAHIAANWSAVSPSAAGEPPAAVSGALGGSISTEAGPSGGVRVGTNLAYGRALEFGTSRMVARPWLRPAVEGVRAEVAGLVREMMVTNQGGEQDAGNQASDTGSVNQRGRQRGDGDL
jgi:hypothetical protein